jgi:hypothetical protein
VTPRTGLVLRCAPVKQVRALPDGNFLLPLGPLTRCQFVSSLWCHSPPSLTLRSIIACRSLVPLPFRRSCALRFDCSVLALTLFHDSFVTSLLPFSPSLGYSPVPLPVRRFCALRFGRSTPSLAFDFLSPRSFPVSLFPRSSLPRFRLFLLARRSHQQAPRLFRASNPGRPPPSRLASAFRVPPFAFRSPVILRAHRWLPPPCHTSREGLTSTALFRLCVRILTSSRFLLRDLSPVRSFVVLPSLWSGGLASPSFDGPVGSYVLQAMLPLPPKLLSGLPLLLWLPCSKVRQSFSGRTSVRCRSSWGYYPPFA